MNPRNTSTGAVLENMILPALERGGYEVSVQKHIGCRPGGRRHMVDAVAKRGEEQFLISLKWQQVGGTAEQKVPFEVICLKEAVKEGTFSKAYLVLGGAGWSLRDYFASGGLRQHIDYGDEVEIMKLEEFVAKANKSRL